MIDPQKSAQVHNQANAMVDAMLNGNTFASIYHARVVAEDNQATLKPFADALGQKMSQLLKARSSNGQVHVAYIDQLAKEMQAMLLDVARNFGK